MHPARSQTGVTRARLNSLAGWELGCLENDPRVDGTSRAGVGAGSAVASTELCVSRHPKAAAPRWSLTTKEMGLLYFISVSASWREREREGGRGQPGAPLCSPAQGSRVHT